MDGDRWTRRGKGWEGLILSRYRAIIVRMCMLIRDQLIELVIMNFQSVIQNREQIAMNDQIPPRFAIQSRLHGSIPFFIGIQSRYY